jgi:hypothetical protein
MGQLPFGILVMCVLKCPGHARICGLGACRYDPVVGCVGDSHCRSACGQPLQHQRPLAQRGCWTRATVPSGWWGNVAQHPRGFGGSPTHPRAATWCCPLGRDPSGALGSGSFGFPCPSVDSMDCSVISVGSGLVSESVGHRSHGSGFMDMQIGRDRSLLLVGIRRCELGVQSGLLEPAVVELGPPQGALPRKLQGAPGQQPLARYRYRSTTRSTTIMVGGV